MFLNPQWVQQGLDALRATLDVDPALKRDMIQFLFDEGFWDEKKLQWESATSRFDGCLNPAKKDFFKFSEIWALMKKFRRHELFYAMADDLGFYRPREKPTEERRLELLEEIATTQQKLLDHLTSKQAELARLDQPAGNVRMHPAVVEGRGSFSRNSDGEKGRF